MKEGIEYHTKIQERKGEDVGAAHVRIAVKFLEELAKTKVTAMPEGNRNREIFRNWWKEMTNWIELKLKQEIGIFKVTKPRVASSKVAIDNYAKIQFAFGPASQELKHALLEIMTEMGWIVKAGAAPQSLSERKLRELVRKK